MLVGELIELRARRDSDVAILHAELYEDVATRVRADTRPWEPIPAGSPASPYAVRESTGDAAFFSIVERASGELAGEALLWGIDLHNRAAQVGISLRPAFRSRGLSTDSLRVLCRYGFAIRGLHRLQLETLVDNEPMLRAALGAGFRQEGTLRHAVWADGCFADLAVLGLLVDP